MKTRQENIRLCTKGELMAVLVWAELDSAIDSRSDKRIADALAVCLWFWECVE